MDPKLSLGLRKVSAGYHGDFTSREENKEKLISTGGPNHRLKKFGVTAATGIKKSGRKTREFRHLLVAG